MPEFCNRNTKALVFYEKGKMFTILTLNGTALILKVLILKPCILYVTIDSLLDLVKSETYQKQVISPVALPSENDNEG